MNITLIPLALLVVASCCLIPGHFQLRENNEPEKINSVQRYQVPLVLNFDKYAKYFKKSYSSATQYLVRYKVYLANAFGSWISAIKYKNGLETHYESVNQMSDYTSDERSRIFGWGRSKAPTHHGEIPVANYEDIKHLLTEAVRKQGASETYRAISDELRKPVNNPRTKRSIDVNSIPHQKLNVNDLVTFGIRGDDMGRETILPNDIPKPDNPSYEPPEVISFGSVGTIEGEDIPEVMIRRLGESKTNITDLRLQLESAVKPQATRSGKRYYEDTTIIVNTKVKKPKEKLPDEIWSDHRETGCLQEAKTQGTCGSCYIFSTLAMMEYNYCKDVGKTVDFSEQYVLDCGMLVGMGGCDGGWEREVIQFVNSHGLELERNYPYVYDVGLCPYEKTSRSMGYLRPAEIEAVSIELEHVDELLDRMPMLVVMKTSPRFAFYGGGVHNPGDRCKNGEYHEVLVVGRGRENGQEYYLIRNSHSVFYGQNGYYKLAKKSSKYCLLKGSWVVFKNMIERTPIFHGEETNERHSMDRIQANYVNSLPGILKNMLSKTKGDIEFDRSVKVDEKDVKLMRQVGDLKPL